MHTKFEKLGYMFFLQFIYLDALLRSFNNVYSASAFTVNKISPSLQCLNWKKQDSGRF